MRKLSRIIWRTLFLYLLGCGALGGTLLLPVADGIDVGGVCKLAWPKPEKRKKKMLFFPLKRLDVNSIAFHLIHWAFNVYSLLWWMILPGIGPLLGTFGFMLFGGGWADCCETDGCDTGCCDWLQFCI